MIHQLLKLAEEFEEYVRELPEFSPVERLLLKYNIIPVSHPLPQFTNADKEKRMKYNRKTYGDSFIDQGDFSKVFKVKYKGQLAIAKITQSRKDVGNMEKLHALASKVGKYKKHILQVFDVITDVDTKSYIVVVEELKPLHKHVSDLFDTSSESESVIKKSLETLNYKFFANFYAKHKLHQILSKDDFKNLCSESVEFFKKELDKVNLEFHYDNLNIVMSEFSRILDKYHGFYAPIINEDLHYYISSIFEKKHNFPPGLDTLNIRMDQYGFIPQKFMPETKSFMEFLILLHKRFGIHYQDLSDVNIMQRPTTGDIVIADPGNFN